MARDKKKAEKAVDQEQKRQFNKCQQCGLKWRGQANWLTCDSCNLYSVCGKCGPDADKLIEHEAGCGN